MVIIYTCKTKEGDEIIKRVTTVFFFFNRKK